MADNNEGFLGGLAQGIQQGSNMGYLAMQARAMRENQMRQSQMMDMQIQQQQQQMQLAQQKQAQEQEAFKVAQASTLIGLLNKTKDDHKPEVWKAIAPKLNDAFGTNFDPEHYSVVTNSVVGQAAKLMDEMSTDPKLYQSHMAKLGSLAALADEDQQKALESARKFLEQADPLREKKVQNASLGTFAFQGTQNGEAVFTNSKSTDFYTSGGKQTSINPNDFVSKTEAPKLREEARKIQEAQSALSELSKTMATLPAGVRGKIASGVSTATFGKAYPQVKAIQDQRKAIAVQIYRAQTGDTRLSDADAAQRALPMVADVSEDPQVQMIKNKRIEELFTKRLSLISQGRAANVQQYDNDVQNVINQLTGK